MPTYSTLHKVHKGERSHKILVQGERKGPVVFKSGVVACGWTWPTNSCGSQSASLGKVLCVVEFEES